MLLQVPPGSRIYADSGYTNYFIEDILKDAHRITAAVLIVYGYQDYEPITQAYLMKDRIQHTKILLILQLRLEPEVCKVMFLNFPC